MTLRDRGFSSREVPSELTRMTPHGTKKHQSSCVTKITAQLGCTPARESWNAICMWPCMPTRKEEHCIGHGLTWSTRSHPQRNSTQRQVRPTEWTIKYECGC